MLRADDGQNSQEREQGNVELLLRSCLHGMGGRGEGGVCVQREGERILLQIKSDLDESQVLKRALEAKIKDIGGFISKR